MDVPLDELEDDLNNLEIELFSLNKLDSLVNIYSSLESKYANVLANIRARRVVEGNRLERDNLNRCFVCIYSHFKMQIRMNFRHSFTLT